jgi:hypothetical protein
MDRRQVVKDRRQKTKDSDPCYGKDEISSIHVKDYNIQRKDVMARQNCPQVILKNLRALS